MERIVSNVRGSFFAGEEFVDLADAQQRAETWCRTTAGLRIHGTTQQRPIEVFAAEEASRLLPVPLLPYDLPVYAHPKVHRDHHVEVAKALYSVPGISSALGSKPPGEDLLAGCADQDPSPPTGGRALHRPR